MSFLGIKNLNRLFVNDEIIEKKVINLEKEQTHYLANVMRLKNQDEIKIFNGQDGEWLAQIVEIQKNKTHVLPITRLKKQTKLQDVWLLFSPVKKNETDFIIEKATELGVTKIIPVITKRTNVTRVNLERFKANAIEASEQCERLCVPELAKEDSLENIINQFPKNKTLFFLDERGENGDIATAFARVKEDACFLVGPEGGFDESEKKKLQQKDFVVPITMGSRILRAETACLAALSCWQAIKGDWKNRTNDYDKL